MNRFRPPRNAAIHTPAKSFTFAGNDTVKKTFRGIDGLAFGFNRIIIGSTAPNQMRVTAKLNNDTTIFENVHISALQNLFKHKSLLAPFVIMQSNSLEISITDESGAAQTANVMLAGYDHHSLQAFQEHQKNRWGKIISPTFLSGADTLAIGQARKLVEVPQKSVDVQFNRMAIGSDSIDKILLSMNIFNDEIKSEVFASQVNDEFYSMASIVPYELSSNVPFRLFVTNTDGAATHNISFIAEAYIK